MKYDYECTSCAHKAVEEHPMKQDALIICPTCGEHTYRKILSSQSFILIGEGWESHEKSGRYHIKGGT